MHDLLSQTNQKHESKIINTYLPDELGECCVARVADLADWGGGPFGGGGATAPGGDADGALRGLPGGSVSVTDMSAAMGEGPPVVPADAAPDPTPPLPGGDPAARLSGEFACPFDKLPTAPV